MSSERLPGCQAPLIILLYIVYYVILCLSFLSSLTSFRLDSSVGPPWISVLLGLTCLTEFYALYGYKLLRSHHHNNLAVYNAYRLVEFLMYVCFFHSVLRADWIRKNMLWFTPLVSVLWWYTTYRIFGEDNWNSYIISVETLFVLLASGFFYYQLLADKEVVVLYNNTEFWIVTALIIFFACQFPFSGMLNFLNAHFKETAKKFVVLFVILNIGFYALLTYAYLCRIVTRKF